MNWRTVAWGLLALLAAVFGWFLFSVVVALHVGAWVYGDKMALAQAPYGYLLGAFGAAMGACAVLLLRTVVRAATRWLRSPADRNPAKNL